MSSPLPNTEPASSSQRHTTPSAPFTGNDRTQCKTLKFDMKWTIHGFQLHQGSKSWLRNTGVTMAELGLNDYEGLWRMCIGPNTAASGLNDDTMYIYLILKDNSENPSYSGGRNIPVVAQVRFTIANPGCEDTLIKESLFRAIFNRKTSFWSIHATTYTALFGSGEAPGQLRGGSLTISMQITLTLQEDTSSFTSTGQREFAQRQLQWANSGHEYDCDFVLRSMDGKEFFANPFLLAAQSPVFAAMLNHDTKEKQSMCCEMKDVDGETVEILVDYLYGCETGKINGHNAERVLVMADKYQLMHLRSFSEQVLTRAITMENAVYSLRFATLHKLEGLMGASLKVIEKNMGKILSDKDLVKSDPDMMRIILAHCAEKARRTVKSYES